MKRNVKTEPGKGEKMRWCLQNVNHTFDVEVGETGFTVRKGRKWYDKCRTGDIVELWECKRNHRGNCKHEFCRFSGEGEITHITLERLKNLSPELLMFEHNRDCRDYEKLKNTLIKVYGTFDDDEIVTLLFYKRLTKGYSCLERLLNQLRSIFR